MGYCPWPLEAQVTTSAHEILLVLQQQSVERLLRKHISNLKVFSWRTETDRKSYFCSHKSLLVFQCKKITYFFSMNRPFFSCVLSYLAMNASEAGGDFALIQTSLLFSCKYILVSLRT